MSMGVFVYNPTYLGREDAVPLDPYELPLRPGRFETVKLKGIFGVLRDASPDAWGRHIIERHLNSAHDVGGRLPIALARGSRGRARIRPRKTPPAPTNRFNQVIALEELLRFAKAVEADDSEELPPQIAELVQPGTSLGGARPKNVVETQEGLWSPSFQKKAIAGTTHA